MTPTHNIVPWYANKFITTQGNSSPFLNSKHDRIVNQGREISVQSHYQFQFHVFLFIAMLDIYVCIIVCIYMCMYLYIHVYVCVYICILYVYVFSFYMHTYIVHIWLHMIYLTCDFVQISFAADGEKI